MGLHIRISFGESKIRQGAMVMERSDYEQLVSLIREADQIDRELLGDHSRTHKALQVLKRAREILRPTPPNVSSGPDA